MKKVLIAGLLSSTTFFLFGQDINTVINAGEVEKIEQFLSADALRGRKVFTPEIDKAADFIVQEFKKAGLVYPEGSDGFRQSFSILQPRFIRASAILDGQRLEEKNIIAVTSRPELTITEDSGYQMAAIAAGDNLFQKAREYVQAKKNLLVSVDESFAASFPRLAGFKRGMFSSPYSVVFILGNHQPSSFQIEAIHEITEQKLANVVGILPGKSKKSEYVIFSGHYDHIGVGRAINGDSIFNGANDDAAGTTAVIMLARYFKALGGNERTLVFAAFTAEESGGYGSQYFSRQFAPDKVVAMFNIEMIGTDSKWGKNSAYITGFDKSDMGTILQNNLKGSSFMFYPDPYPQQNLFYRSDNATLARLGVPAHTISTSKMDSEPNYHKVTDEIGTLDMQNMAEIIKAIAISSSSIISGKDTPARVDTGGLR